MNSLLTKLGVPMKVQEFFNAGELLFGFGEHFEHFGDGFHRVPTTPNLWMAGSDQTKEVIITSNAMEAIAYLTINQHRYTDIGSLTFLAVGNLPHPGQINWICKTFPKSKYTLVFGKDLFGRLADVILGTGLRKKPVSLAISDFCVHISYGNRSFKFEQNSLSLSLFEKTSGLRSGIRTRKPKQFDTYLNQLKHDARQ